MEKPDTTPVHQWTNGGEMVRILKCVDWEGKGHGGFQWPESGPVTPAIWSRDPNCESGGLFGWAWGLCFGDGKEPDYGGRWIVFEAHPDDVIDVDGKVKAVPNPELGRTPTVIYCGTHAKANQLILDGQIAWVQHAAKGASSATGYRGASSATGDRGASSATGYSGASSATGNSGASSATGNRGIASLTGELGTVEASATGLAVSTAEECWWKVVDGAVFVQRWEGGLAVFTSKKAKATTGDRLRFFKGKIVERIKHVGDKKAAA